MMAASRDGERCSPDRWARSSRSQVCLRGSGGVGGRRLCMLVSGDTADGIDEGVPGLALAGEHLAALGRHLIEAPAPFAGFLDPGALNPAALFEAIEQRIERINVEDELAARARLDQLAELVAVAGPGFEKRKDEEL